MSALPQHTIVCPYCNEMNEVLIEYSEDAQDYIEDCQVCCRPIHLLITSIQGETHVEAKSEDEV